MRRSFRIHPFVGFAIVLIIVIVVSLFGLQTLHQRDNADELAAQTSTVITRIDEVLLGLVNMETGLRGYLLTGNSALLDHYDQGKSEYAAALKELNTLTSGNPSLVARWKMVADLEQQWDSQWAEKGIQLRQDVDAGKASNAALSSHVIAERDENLMDAIRAQLDAGKQEETSRLVGQILDGQRTGYLAYDVMVAGMLIALALGLITGAFLNRSNKEKTRQIELQHLLFQEREKERFQLARNLHDGPVQELLGLSFTIQQMLVEEAGPGIQERLSEMKTALQGIVGELRENAMELRSPVLTRFGLQKAIQADLEKFSQQHPEIQAHFTCEERADTLPAQCQEALFRIYQEVMRNIVRHAHATEVNICYQVVGKAASLIIQDNGVGFNLPEDWLTLARKGHLGLAGIRERAEAIGGRVDIHSKPKEGTLIQVSVPL